MTVNIETVFELKKTAEFYGYYIQEFIGEYTGKKGYALVEQGSDITIASWKGVGALENCINWCNWFFNELAENEKRKQE